MFVIEIGVFCPNNSKKIMQIHDNRLIAECTSYDFKEMLERKKVKSWLKSVSAFANTDGGSLFYGVNDEGEIVGLKNVQADADFISEMIKARLDPVPEVQLIPIEHEGRTLLEVKVKAGVLTPYYYYQARRNAHGLCKSWQRKRGMQLSATSLVGTERYAHDVGFVTYTSGCK